MLLAAERLITADGDAGAGWLRIDRAIIAEMGAGRPPAPPDLSLSTVFAGFVDIHAHGAMGHDFGRVGDDPETVIAYHAASGTTSLVATLATAPLRSLVDRVRELAPLVRDGSLAGLHLEGPWISSVRRGAHHPDLLRPPAIDDIDRIIDAGDGTIRMVTLAPELPGALQAIERLVGAGVIAALGHTDADYATTMCALDAGATVGTHLYNGMRPLHHRDPGLAGVMLTDQRATVELIGDGVHVHDAIVDLTLAAAAGRVALISDCMSAAGLPDGVHELAGSRVRVTGGVAELADGSSLAGSTSTLGHTVARLLARGVSPVVLADAAITRPAAALALKTPELRLGGPADLVEIASGGVARAMKNGEWVDPAIGSPRIPGNLPDAMALLSNACNIASN
ncbi:N-acetylglucosamine-6-phosphate deacetylase [Microbacterium sp. B2969]|uniref:N-acetylglucosamine-6-phosphate deacetylase n=1 Tax=Microbacterium alkaliflavum TaxID=3248839 RepID=A0ABW7Q418_9MICO